MWRCSPTLYYSASVFTWTHRLLKSLYSNFSNNYSDFFYIFKCAKQILVSQSSSNTVLFWQLVLNVLWTRVVGLVRLGLGACVLVLFLFCRD